jgi:hypothetical protein
MEEIPRETFEYCSICNSVYTIKGRKQHLNTKKHRIQMAKNNIESNNDVPIEQYSYKLDGHIIVENN